MQPFVKEILNFAHVQALPEDGQLVACEKDEAMLQLAREAWVRAGVYHKVSSCDRPLSIFSFKSTHFRFFQALYNLIVPLYLIAPSCTVDTESFCDSPLDCHVPAVVGPGCLKTPLCGA